MLTGKAYAKINLFLRILDKREDGFHNIETIFHKIVLFDEITISPHYNIVITSNNNQLPTDEKNFCYKAVLALQNKLNITQGVHIKIEKNIPIGSGLGGGSSDAALVLRLLPQLWKSDINNTELNKIALSIGSDVPYFLQQYSAYATGRGENLKSFLINLPFWIVGIHPRSRVSTAWAYSTLSESRKTIPNKFFEHSNINIDNYISNISDFAINDFEEVVFNQSPSLKNIKNDLLTRGAKVALLSGTGSSVFGLFDNKDTAIETQNFYKSNNIVSLTPPSFQADN